MSLVRGTITRVYLSGFLSVDHSVRFKTSDLASRLNAIKTSKKIDGGSYVPKVDVYPPISVNILFSSQMQGPQAYLCTGTKRLPQHNQAD